MSDFNPPHVEASLAELPGVKHTIRAIKSRTFGHSSLQSSGNMGQAFLMEDRKSYLRALEKLQQEVRRLRVVIDTLKAEMIRDAKP